MSPLYTAYTVCRCICTSDTREKPFFRPNVCYYTKSNRGSQSQSASLCARRGFWRLTAMKTGINGAATFGKEQNNTRAGLPKKSCRPAIRPQEALVLFLPKQKQQPRRSVRLVCGPCPFDRTPASPPPPPPSGGGDRDGSAVFSSLKKIFSFFSRTIDFCAAQGFILFSAEKCGASPNETRASAALYAGCKYKAFARPFCGARKGRKHKKSHLPLGVLPLAERTNAGNSRSE